MKTVLVACAESALVDQQTNKLSLFGILEELSGAGFPGFIPSAAFVIVLEREPKEPSTFDLVLTIDIGGNKIFETPIKMQFQGLLRSRAVASMQAVPILGPGIMTFSARHGRKVLGSWSVPITQVGSSAFAPTDAGITASSAFGSNNLSKKKPSSKKRKQKKRK